MFFVMRGRTAHGGPWGVYDMMLSVVRARVILSGVSRRRAESKDPVSPHGAVWSRPHHGLRRVRDASTPFASLIPLSMTRGCMFRLLILEDSLPHAAAALLGMTRGNTPQSYSIPPRFGGI